MTYREAEPKDLDVEARESDAVRALGRWRDRTKTIVLAIFGIGGLAVLGVGYYAMQEIQFRYNDGIAFVKLNVMAGCAAWAVTFAVGWFVARAVVKNRTPGKLAELAARYEVPRERLQEIADMVGKL